MQYKIQCPVCNSSDFDFFLKSKDYFLTGEEFDIISCKNCGLKLTSPRPEQSQIGKYYKSEEYISHNTKNNNIKTRLYKWVRKHAVNNKINIIKKHIVYKNTPPRLLDIGCGTGYFLSQAKLNGFQCLGFEPIEEARKQAQKTNPDIEIYNQEEFNITTQRFDVVTLWHVLEHLYNLSEDLSKIVKLMQADGILIIAVPNYNSFDAEFYGHFWAAYDVPRHLYHFSVTDINNIAAKYGLVLTEVLPMKFDSYYVSMLSEKYKKSGVLKVFVKAIINGCKSNHKAYSKNNTLGYSSQIYVLKNLNK